MPDQEATVVEYYGASSDGAGGGLVRVTLDARQESILDAWRDRMDAIFRYDLPAMITSMERAGVPRRAAENAAHDVIAKLLEYGVPADE